MFVDEANKKSKAKKIEIYKDLVKEHYTGPLWELTRKKDSLFMEYFSSEMKKNGLNREINHFLQSHVAGPRYSYQHECDYFSLFKNSRKYYLVFTFCDLDKRFIAMKTNILKESDLFPIDFKCGKIFPSGKDDFWEKCPDGNYTFWLSYDFEDDIKNLFKVNRSINVYDAADLEENKIIEEIMLFKDNIKSNINEIRQINVDNIEITIKPWSGLKYKTTLLSNALENISEGYNRIARM